MAVVSLPDVLVLHHINIDTNKTSTETEEASVPAVINVEEIVIATAAITLSRKCKLNTAHYNRTCTAA